MPTFVPSDVQIKNNPTLVVVDAKRVRGAYMVFADTAARDALDPSVKQSGMKVRTLSPDSEWTLEPDLTTWKVSLGGSGGENGAEHRAARITELYVTRNVTPFYTDPSLIHSITYRRAHTSILSPAARDEVVFLALDGSPRGLYSMNPVSGAVTAIGPTALPEGLLFTHAEYVYILVGTPNAADGTPALAAGGVYDTLTGESYTINGTGVGIEGFPQAATVQYITGDENPQVGIFIVAHTNTAGTYGGGVYILQPGEVSTDLPKVVDFDVEATPDFYPEAICAGDAFSFWVLFRDTIGSGGLLRKYSYGTLGAGNWTVSPQIVSEVDVGHAGHHLLFDGKYVWVLGLQEISRVSMSGTVTSVPTGFPGFDIDFRSNMAFDGATIWAMFRGGYARIEPETMKFLSQNYNATGDLMGEIVCAPDLDNTRVFYLDPVSGPTSVIRSLEPLSSNGIPDPGGLQGELLFNDGSQWSALPVGTASQVLRTGGVGADPFWANQLVFAGEAQGDTIYRDASTWTRLPAGNSGQFLKTNGLGLDPEWASTHHTIRTMTSSGPATLQDSVILCDAQNITVTLPTILGDGLYVGKSLTIKSIYSAPPLYSIVSLDPNGGSIDGLSGLTPTVIQKSGVEILHTGGNNWVILNQFGEANSRFPLLTVTGPSYTITATDSFLLMNSSTTITLPSLASSYVGKTVFIKSNTTSSTTLTPAGGVTLDGSSSSIVYPSARVGLLLCYSATSTWQVVSQAGAATNLAFTGEAQGDITYRNATIWTRLPAGTASQVLRTGGAGANPSWTNQLVFTGEAQGDIVYRNASTWVQLPAGTASQVLRTGGAGADPSWTNQLVFTGEAQGDIAYRNATTWVRLPAGTSGQVLTTGGTGANPSWTTPSATSTPSILTVTTSYTALSTDYYIRCNHTSSITITLPVSPATAQYINVKDVSTAGAATNNIVVVPTTGTIDGQASLTISANRASYGLLYVGSNTWDLV